MSKFVLSVVFLLTVWFSPALAVEKPMEYQPATPNVLDPGY